jgi:hypothetical protein
MGRSSRRKRERRSGEVQPDPERAARIAAQRAKEAQVRSNLESLLKQGNELTAHLHYDKVGKELGGAAGPLIAKLTGLLKEAPDRIGECIVKNHALERECRGLRKRISGQDDSTEVAAIERVLESLPEKHAIAFRLLTQLEATAPPESSAAVDAAFARAASTLAEMTELLKQLMAVNTSHHELADEKIQRGWVEASEIEPLKGRSTEGIARFYAMIRSYEDVLTSMRERAIELMRTREDLIRHLDSPTK